MRVVHCALIAKRCSSYLGAHYEQVQRRRETGETITALARKFPGIIYGTLKNNWIFEGFPNFVLAEAKA